VSTHGCWLGGGSSFIRQTNASPSSSSPDGVKPAEIIALYPVVNVAAHPRSMSPPQGPKSTTTISPVVVLQLLSGSADAVPASPMLPSTTEEPTKIKIASAEMLRLSPDSLDTGGLFMAT